MKSIKVIVFSCLFFIRNDIFVTTNSLPLGIKETTLKQYPFIAFISGKWSCSAVLITPRHLVTPAFCVDRETPTTVFFDFDQLPAHSSTPRGTNTQTYSTSRIIIHEHFVGTNKENGYPNDIAVVELEQPVTYSDTIRPAKLISGEQQELFGKGTNFQVIGWYHDKSSVMSAETIELQDQSTCDSYFGRSFMDDQKLCAKFAHEKYSGLIGNVMTFQNKVVGFLVARHKCLMSSPECSKTHTFLNVVPFLKWISEKINVSVGELTGTDEKTSEALKQIEKLTQKLQEVDGKCQKSTSHADQKINEIFSKFESNKEVQARQVQILDQQMDSVYAKVDKMNKEFERITNECKLDQEQQKNVKERTNNLIQELAIQNNAINGLQAKISKIESECISKTKTEEYFKNLLNSMQEKENERLNKLEEQMNKFTDNLKSITLKINEISNVIDKSPIDN